MHAGVQTKTIRIKVKAHKIYPRSAKFLLRFFKSDRLLAINTATLREKNGGWSKGCDENGAN